MPSKISTNLRFVIDQFTPDILGVFWITNEVLSRDLLGFDEFNYLFDGLISQYLYGKTMGEGVVLPRSNIFYTKNFNQNIFLAHIKQDGEIAGVLDEQIALIQENTSNNRKIILILNNTSTNWVSNLQKRYPKFDFHDLESLNETNV
jgi:hypothetical protein